MTDRPVRAVLDATAIAAYCSRAVDVGEIIGEIADEGARAAPPILCLARARSTVADSDLLDLLIAHPDTMVTGLDPGDHDVLAAAYDLVGAFDVASVVVLSDGNDSAAIITSRPDLYSSLAGGGPTVYVPPT